MPAIDPVPLQGSHRPPVEGARELGPAKPDTTVQLTVQLAPRNREDLAARIDQPNYTPYTREEYVHAHAPTDQDITAIRDYLDSNGLTITAITPDRRSLIVTGTVAAAERAFNTQLSTYEADGQQFHARTGALSVPANVAPLIEGVFGLDTRPFARPHFRRPPGGRNPGGAVPLSALDVAAAYTFPGGDGAGQTIGIVELGGGYREPDLQQYFSTLGLPTPQVTAVGVNGGANNPGSDPNGADGEVELDIEVAGAIAPAAHLVVYFARDASERSFVDVLNAVVNDTTNAPSVVSISWGGPEQQATAAARQAMDSAFASGASLGITFLAAAGDNGSADEPGGTAVNVDYPASSPFVTGCGGTELTIANGAITSEVVWNEGQGGHGATGGGISQVYAIPSWQQHVTLPAPVGNGHAGRGVPDVAGNADPFSGYKVLVDGQAEPIGGTSAVAPLWAGLIARINAAIGKPCGFVNPALYAAGGIGFNDITDGNNAIPPVPGYSAGKGWDACTGWGSPNGAQIKAVLEQYASTSTQSSGADDATQGRAVDMCVCGDNKGIRPLGDPGSSPGIVPIEPVPDEVVLGEIRELKQEINEPRGNLILAGTSAHGLFKVYYHVDLGAIAGMDIARAILDRCEDGYYTLQRYFGRQDMSAAIPFHVVIMPQNFGALHHCCCDSTIFVGTNYGTIDQGFIVQLVFAEVVEVFSAHQSKQPNEGYDCTTTNGEGLSRVLAASLSPGPAVWRANVLAVKKWLQPLLCIKAGQSDHAGGMASQTAGTSTSAASQDIASRDQEVQKLIENHVKQSRGSGEPTFNFVTANALPPNDGTGTLADQNDASNGCAILFLHWLHFKNGYDWEQIVQAAAGSLGATYEKLKQSSTAAGQESSATAEDGWREFVNDVWALVKNDHAQLDSDNPFGHTLFPA